MNFPIDWRRLEAVVRRDPGGRGLASFIDDGRPLLIGHLERAARELAERGRRALIVTGFCILTDSGAAAETDGPLGAVYLAAMLQAGGIVAQIATDRVGAPVVRAALDAAGLAEELLIEFPQFRNDEASRAAIAAWRDQFVAGANGYSHLVAVERVGPNHTSDSIRSQSGDEESPHVVAEFERLVPAGDRDRCRNMRGVSIDEQTAPLHVLFERTAGTAANPRTIGIVDGGNEIGCGVIPWRTLCRAVTKGPAALTACRIATDDTVVSGVSNWGAYALGAAVANLRGAQAAIEQWTPEKEGEVLDAIVERGGAVDGVTKLRQATIDGVSAADYLRVFGEIRKACRPFKS